ncbi:DUF805 domain-containing protein [Hyphomonas sp.]|uniref:DUF805 domain-containing protein n=1 Tax=Hyphomonas sp. TaxID=87 RepID=UPI00391ADFA0
MELYLNPNGRIDQQTYWQAVLVLFGISAAITLLSAFVNPFFGLLSFIFAWPWIAVHVKRFHDAGKTGWLTLALVALGMVLSFLLGALLPGLFGVNTAELEAELQRDLSRAQAQGDLDAIMSATTASLQQVGQAQLIPSIVSTGIMTAIFGTIMGMLKTDPNDNQYGPGPGGPGELFS